MILQGNNLFIQSRTKVQMYFMVYSHYKVECVFSMAVVSILPNAEFGRNGHREDTPDFTFYEVFVVYVNAACCYDPYFILHGIFKGSPTSEFWIWDLLFLGQTRVRNHEKYVREIVQDFFRDFETWAKQIPRLLVNLYRKLSEKHSCDTFMGPVSKGWVLEHFYNLTFDRL